MMAVLLKESGAEKVRGIMETDEEFLISAGTLAEARIVALGQSVENDLDNLLDTISPDVEPLSEAGARAVSEAYSKWGKGFHPAQLNFGDCFAYATAKRLDCQLLFVGNDFSKTDIVPAI